MGRNEELETFLKRVEDYDTQRRENNCTSEVHRGRHSQESIERARKLLENGVAIIDESTTPSVLGASELAYRSAYNYERTFSPKGVTSEEKTYIVSEEDYLLLQRLKAKEKSPPPLPSRERVNEQRLEAVSMEEKPPALPCRRYYNSGSSIDSIEKPEHSDGTMKARRGEKPPIPPKSRTSLRALEIKAEVESKGVSEYLAPSLQSHRLTESEKSSSGKSVKPELKSSPRKFNLNAELELPTEAKTMLASSKPLTSKSSHSKFVDSVQGDKQEAPKEMIAMLASSKPLISKSAHVDFLDSVQGDKQEVPKEMTAMLASSKPLISKSTHVDFLDSVQGDKQEVPKEMTAMLASSKPLISKSAHVDFLDSVQRDKQEVPKEMTAMLASSKPLISKSAHVDFLDSVQGSKQEFPAKMTQFNLALPNKIKTEGFIHLAAKPVPPIKPAKPADLAKSISLSKANPESFISSALKTSYQPSTSDVNQVNFAIPLKLSSESFLNSALKLSPPTKETSPTKLNVLPRPKESRPANLKRPQPERPIKPVEFAHMKLTPKPEKLKPQVPPKNSEIVLPKLRHISPANSSSPKSNVPADTGFISNLKKVDPHERSEEGESLPEALTRLSNLSKPPPSPKRQEDVPEALTKLGHLSKPASSPKRENETPEALSHLEKLNKVSKQPPIPVRKISMAEALQKAQELKMQKQANLKTQPEPEQPRDMKLELGAVLMAQKLRSNKTCLSGSSGAGCESNNSSTTSLGYTQTTPPTPAGPNDTKPVTLVSFNKTRTRGPRRKPPSALTKSK